MAHKADIDGGKPFEWGRASNYYAQFRDIYPPIFYEKIAALRLCGPGMRVLDLGTGTGVLPRGLHGCGARFVGVDAAAGQIEKARQLSAAMGDETEYHVCPAEEIDFAPDSFDAATACQCFWYFGMAKLLPRLKQALKPGALLGILSMGWLPGESEIAKKSEEMVLKYNPDWTGHGWQRIAPKWPARAGEYAFEPMQREAFAVALPFTRESWTGRMLACRGVAAALEPGEVRAFEAEHTALMKRLAPAEFELPHWVTMLVLKNIK